MVALYAQNVVVNGALMKNKFTFLKYKIKARYNYIKCWLTGGHKYVIHYISITNYVDICSKCGKHWSD